MNQRSCFFVLANRRLIPVEVRGLTAIGGIESQGIQVDGLKHPGDYLIVSSQDNKLLIRSLIGDDRNEVTLDTHESYQVEDIQVLNLGDASIQDSTSLMQPILEILDDVVGSPTADQALETVLDSLMAHLGHEKGILFTSNLSGDYQAVAYNGLHDEDPWLSESLIQQVIKNQEPVILQNVIGSDYDESKSLIATGFLSVSCWPLIVRGKNLGLILTGSSRPQVNDIAQAKIFASMLVRLASVAIHFRLKEDELLKLTDEIDDHPLLTQNAELLRLGQMAKKVAPSKLSTLVIGETGVGKEVLSQWIHKHSDRSGRPFVAVNCAAIPKDLIESVLFGHRKGSFTGATKDQVGKIQQANHGTLFLDEIGDLPLELQAKLLRVLQEGQLEPIGSDSPIAVDIRVISATHRDLSQMITQGSFREDLYYRLAEITLEIPPLRERRDDIRLLANHFIKSSPENVILSEDAWRWLEDQSWKGNVRELKSSIQRGIVLSSEGVITPEDLQGGVPGGRKQDSPTIASENWLGGSDLENAKHNFTLQKIQQALVKTDGNRTHAAKLLGITPRTLFRYVDKLPMKELSQ